MSDLVRFIATYGVLAVFLGCLAEGETMAIIGGFLAHQGVISPVPTFAAAFLGALAADIGFFFVGRRLEKTAFVAKSMEKPGFSHARKLVQRHPYLFVLSNRFIYGLRTVGGLAAGMSGLRVPVFLLLSIVSALAWATLFTAIGWIFGASAEQTIRRLFSHHRDFLIATLCFLALAGFMGFLLRSRRAKSPSAGKAVDG